MTAHDDLERQLTDFLRDGPEELPYQSFDAVRDRTEQTGQRVVLGPWRLPEMNKIVTIGLGAAAVVLALFVGIQLFGSPNAGLGGEPTSPASAEPTAEATPEATPSPSAEAGLPLGPFLVFDPSIMPAPFDDGPPITVTIAASGWTAIPENGVLLKGDQADPPEGAGAFLLTGDTGADGLYVYGDPCDWESTTPAVPATTVDDIVQALEAQASRDATAPEDVTVGGYAGKSITLTVPNDGADRATAFGDCDQGTFATYGIGPEGPARYHQGPGQVDEFWILDVDGQIVILDASYGPATPADLIEEIRAMVESATFGTP